MVKRSFSFSLLVLISVISGCTMSSNGPTSSDGSNAPRAWFDAPLPNTVIRPPNPCQIVAHSASANGIKTLELTVNGTISTFPSPDTENSLVTLTRDCGLSQPGTYTLLIRAQDHEGNWSAYAETSLVIVGDETPSNPVVESTSQSAEPSPSATVIPSVTAGDVSIENISTDNIYVGDLSCGALEETITARATAPKGVQVVVLFYRFSYSGAPSGFQSESMTPIGNDLYQRTLNMNSLVGKRVPFEEATFQYQVVVQQPDGDVSIRTPVLANISVKTCGVVRSAPTAVLTCSSYTDKRSCIGRGCNWISKPGIVPIYVCQNP